MEPSTTPKSTPQKCTPLDPDGPDRPESLTKELMVSLSKEIETTMTSIMAFRTKVGFGMFIGPFLLLSSFIVAAKGQSVSFNLTGWGWFAVILLFACYLAIAIAAAKVEDQAFSQCDAWRKLMWELSTKPSMKICEERLKVKHKAYWAYFATFALLFVSVGAAVFIIQDAKAGETPKPPGAAPTYRIEQVSP